MERLFRRNGVFKDKEEVGLMAIVCKGLPVAMAFTELASP